LRPFALFNKLLLLIKTKKKIVPIGEVEDVKGLAQLLGCRVASLPITY